MRIALEPLLYQYGVDIIFTGYGTGIFIVSQLTC